MRQRVYIVEDHDVVRDAYVLLLGLSDDFEVCGVARSAEEALEQIAGVRPDVLLVDISLPGMSGLDLISTLRAAGESVPAIVVSGHDEPAYQERSRRMGAGAFLKKEEAATMLEETIRRMLA